MEFHAADPTGFAFRYRGQGREHAREAFPFDQLPRYLLRDRDAIFGLEFREQVRDMGIHEVLSTPRSPWQRAYVERVIGSIRERISRWKRTRPSHDPFSRRPWGQSWCCRRSAGCTIATNDGLPEET